MNIALIVFLLGLFVIILVGGGVFFLTRRVLTPSPPSPPEELCGIDKACPQGKFCSKGGFCIPENTCILNGDCPQGICLNKQCVPDKCTINEDCGTNNTCIKGKCIARCTYDSNCPGSSICRDGYCRQKKCLLQSDCNFDEACTSTAATYGGPFNPKLTRPEDLGFCVPVLNNCVTDAQCSEGLSCVSGRCTQCTSSEECPHNLVCIRGVCLHPKQESCPSGLVQTEACPKEGCGYTLCCPSTCGRVKCSVDAPCTNPSCSYCVNGYCTCKPAPTLPSANTCARNEDCEEGLVCAKSTFLPPYVFNTGICVANTECSTFTKEKLRCIASDSSSGPDKCPAHTQDKWCNFYTNCCTRDVGPNDRPPGTNCSQPGFCGVSSFCVNGYCRTYRGSYGERCTENKDCLSNVCNKNNSVPICE